MRVISSVKNPGGAKFDGWKAHRTIIAPEGERGPISITGGDCRFYANTVGTFGVDS